VREWLAAQAASGFIRFDAAAGKYQFENEMAMCFVVETSPAFIPGFRDCAEAVFRDLPKLEAAFRTGLGVGWHQHYPSLFKGTERFFRPGYTANLVSEWIPALDGVEAKRKAGGQVAVVGCDHGASTILMAQTYPKATFVGFDYDESSIQRAREAAHEAQVSDRVRFEVATAKEYPGTGYNFVAFFDCLHNMRDPNGAAAHVIKSLKPDGTWLIVEPFANDKLEDNRHGMRADAQPSLKRHLLAPFERSKFLRSGSSVRTDGACQLPRPPASDPTPASCCRCQR
jgi:SAM-dependent methyltransferase